MTSLRCDGQSSCEDSALHQTVLVLFRIGVKHYFDDIQSSRKRNAIVVTNQHTPKVYNGYLEI